MFGNAFFADNDVLDGIIAKGRTVPREHYQTPKEKLRVAPITLAEYELRQLIEAHGYAAAIHINRLRRSA